ncbi:MAG: hypothetical protein DMF68_20770 [Acidobacteria bacterium]|nr:MAG: hypothetical protein DMF68_20770 [Acidobacteriota bacterium]
MQSSPTSSEHQQCPICRAELSPAATSCSSCGSKLADTPAQEIRSLNFLLAELRRWEIDGIVGPEQAERLRASYERRREELREQLGINGSAAKQSAPQGQEARNLAPESQILNRTHNASQTSASASRAGETKHPRALLETLADTHTIRLLLYTGAAMLVVGVIIWLRDILYLKLQEPIVQAALLALGTIIVTISGWLTTLRTRLLLTGRALTLIGSLLVPVNFWFLARSGLIEGDARAWIVCALCTLLYAFTAALLNEKLYVYLTCAAAVATSWTLIYRLDRDAVGLYPTALMMLSLVFLHLSRFFISKTEGERMKVDNEKQSVRNTQSKLSSLTSLELWEHPLAHVALVGAALAPVLYMPLRLVSSPSFAAGFLRLRARDYDPSIAMLLFAFAGYAAWFAGRFIYTNRRAILYTAGALSLLWTEFLLLDGLRLSGAVQLLVIAATAFIIGLAARASRGDLLSAALHRASLTVCVVLAALIYPVLSAAEPGPITHSMILVLLAGTYAVSRDLDEVDERAHAAAAFACAALLIVQALIHLRVGDNALYVPSRLALIFGLILLGASLGSRSRVRYFRAGLYTLSLAFVLTCLGAGLDPLDDAEVYTTTIAILLLVVTYISLRRGIKEFAADARLHLWAGSLLLCAPLVMRSLQYRLLLDLPAPSRDLATLCASLALLFLGLTGRLRAPIITGFISLVLELVALTVTSVHWLQIPLKVYLISVGALILLIWGLLEFRREQILSFRQRLGERREKARERFGEWR